MDANIAQTMEKLFRDAAAAGAPLEGDSEKPPDVEGMVPVLENLLSKLLSKEVFCNIIFSVFDLSRSKW